jgi:signal transduction histidine kinase
VRVRAGDIAPAVALAAAGAVGAVLSEVFSRVDRPIDGVGVALAAAAGLVLVPRRTAPVAALAATTTLTWAYLALGYAYGPILLSFVVGVFTVGRLLPLSRSAPACAAALLGLLTHVLTHPAALPGALGLLPASAWTVVSFTMGVGVRLRREAVDRERAEMVRHRVADERLRIAREVHDVVGHGLVAIKMQADVALHLLATRPEQAETALAAISRTSAEALDEVRATLSVVRGDAGDPPRATAAPGLGQLDDLRDRMADAGLRVQVDARVGHAELPPAVDLAAYRVVQESLTNALRHGGSGRATVRVTRGDDHVVVTVTNTPTAPLARRTAVGGGDRGIGGHGDGSRGGHGGGSGIDGMRERVRAVGGRLTAGATEDGRFVVTAHLPTGGGA